MSISNQIKQREDKYNRSLDGYFISEAEQKLDYNVFPSKSIQKKLQLWVNPYNKALFHSKHMSFDYESKPNYLFSNNKRECQSWKRLSDLILRENKEEMRKFLTQLNEKLYKQIEIHALIEKKKERELK